jgi:hypothetical protein
MQHDADHVGARDVTPAIAHRRRRDRHRRPREIP